MYASSCLFSFQINVFLAHLHIHGCLLQSVIRHAKLEERNGSRITKPSAWFAQSDSRGMYIEPMWMVVSAGRWTVPKNHCPARAQIFRPGPALFSDFKDFECLWRKWKAVVNFFEFVAFLSNIIYYGVALFKSTILFKFL